MAILFLNAINKDYVFLILPIPPIFKNLKSLKPEVLIEAMCKMINLVI